MKKITITFVLFPILFMATPFAIKAQKPAKVTVTIKSLRAWSSDACGNMDFFAKIYIGGQVKSFPVREGNYLTNLNWQFTSFTPADSITFSVEIWDDDDFACGGGDDRVNVEGTSNKITRTFTTLLRSDHDILSRGKPSPGNEVAEIVFHINIEVEAGKAPTVPTYPATPDPVPVRPVTVPVKPVTVPVKPITLPEAVVSKKGILTEGGIWRIVQKYTRLGLDTAGRPGGWFPMFLLDPSIRNCQKDNYYQFNSDGAYQLNDGPTKCAPTDPQIIETGTWSFLENETKLQLVKTGSLSPDVFRIHLERNSLNLYKENYYLQCIH
jgi:hypothetical protein